MPIVYIMPLCAHHHTKYRVMCRLEVALRAKIQDGCGGMYEGAADNRDHQWWQCTIIEKLTKIAFYSKCLSRIYLGNTDIEILEGISKGPCFLSTGDRRFACLSDKTLTIGFCVSRHEWSVRRKIGKAIFSRIAENGLFRASCIIHELNTHHALRCLAC